jgi:hypothetical protein
MPLEQPCAAYANGSRSFSANFEHCGGAVYVVVNGPINNLVDVELVVIAAVICGKIQRLKIVQAN